MLNQAEAEAIVQALQTLPPERVAEVRDFVDFLQARYGVEMLTPAQKDELDRRLADMEANPDDEMSWEEVKAGLSITNHF